MCFTFKGDSVIIDKYSLRVVHANNARNTSRSLKSSLYTLVLMVGRLAYARGAARVVPGRIFMVSQVIRLIIIEQWHRNFYILRVTSVW